MPRVLILDDNASIRDVLHLFFEEEGFEVHAFEHPLPALQFLEEHTVDLVLLDLRLPEMDGLAVLRKIHAWYPELPVVVITAYATLESAIEALRLGAMDYLRKPFELDELRAVWVRIQEVRALREENLRFRQDLAHQEILLETRNPRMQAILSQLERIARTHVPVFISGESGTGKEVVARHLHRISDRHAGPFVAVNMAALPSELVESELFGYRKGAFTGATEDKPGYFELAHGGTLFLDEIAEMPAALQPKLLRVLQDHQVFPLGSRQPVRVDVRIVTATNQDLQSAVREGRFREDLFYRIHVFPIHLPPLRERREDIPLFVEFFLRKYSSQYGLPLMRFSPEAMKVLLHHPWPGNIRELAHVVERAVILSEGVEIPRAVVEDALAGAARSERGDGQPTSLLSLRELEKQHIQRVMEAVGGNKRRAAEILGIDLSTLYRKLDRYGLREPAGGSG